MGRSPGVRAGAARDPDPDVEAALGYLLEHRPEGWRLDEKVERMLLEAERLKWPGLPLPHAVIDFLEYWLVIRTRGRPVSTQGWRAAFRNWCRIEREKSARVQGRAESRAGAGARGEPPVGRADAGARTRDPGPGPGAPMSAEARERVREMIRGLKERFAAPGSGSGSGTGSEEA